MNKDADELHLEYLTLAAKLRERIQKVYEGGKACSLFQAMLAVEMVQLDQAFHTLIEAIEDAEKL